MNTCLKIFLLVLVIYSAIWVGLKYVFYEKDEHSPERMWYVAKEPDMSVSTSRTMSSGLGSVYVGVMLELHKVKTK